MLETWLKTLFTWLPTGPGYYLVIGLIAFFESLAFAGLVVPGSVLVVFAGVLAAHGKGEIVTLFWVTALGSLLGDVLSYWLGARYGSVLLQRPFPGRHRALLARAELFFYAHGGKSLLAGRFIGFLRPFIPFIAGCAAMRPAPFLAWAVTGGLLWGLAYPGLGYLFGASWKLVELWTGRLGLLAGILVGLFVLNLFLWNWLLPRLFRLGGRALRWLQRATEPWRRRCPRLCAWLSDRFSSRHGAGIHLTVGLALYLLLTWLLARLIQAGHLERPLYGLDGQLHRLLTDLWHPVADTLALAVTALTDLPAVLLGWCVIALWLTPRRPESGRWWLLLGGCGGGELLVRSVFGIFARPAPQPYLSGLSASLGGWAEASVFSVTVLVGTAIYLALENIRNWSLRTGMTVAGSSLVLLAGFGRILLGRDWLSGVLTGLVLGVLWLTVLITALESRRRVQARPSRSWGPAPVSDRGRRHLGLLCGLLLAAGASGWHLQTTLAAAGEGRASPASLARTVLPAATEGLTGRPLTPLSLYLEASPPALERILGELGWRPTRPTAAGDILRTIGDALADEPRLDATPHPRLVAGRLPDLAFFRSPRPDERRERELLLLWRLREGERSDLWGALVEGERFGRFGYAPPPAPRDAGAPAALRAALARHPCLRAEERAGEGTAGGVWVVEDACGG